MRILLIICLFIISTSVNASSIKLVTETNYIKEVNGNSGFELLLKTSIDLADSITLKLGLSEGYTGFRSKPFMFNHAGTRFDIGAYWDIYNDLMIGYTHSSRRWFDGANPIDIFDYDSVDTLSIRKEFDLEW